METVRYEMMIFADADGTMPQRRLEALMSDLSHVGGESAVLNCVSPIETGGEGSVWGLRAVVRGESE